MLLDQEFKRMAENHEQEIRNTQAKFDADLQFTKQEHNLAAIKVNIVLILTDI